MGCQTKVVIGQNLVFTITTHDPDTGEITDADSAPIYRVYEDETATPILTGTMSKLDDGNTTGFYSELIACTAANGFEANKSYNIYIQATVDSDTGGISYGFVVENAPLTASDVWTYAVRELTQSAVQVAAAVQGSKIAVTRGDTWSISITGLGSLSGYVSLDFTVKDKLSDADSSAIFRVRKNASGTGDGLLRLNGSGSVTAADGSIAIDSEGDGNITINLKASSSLSIAPAALLHYDVQLITASAVTTLSNGTFSVSGDVTRSTL